MKERFEGEGHRNLIDALSRQEFVSGDTGLADAIAACGQLLELQKGEKLMLQGGEDNDIYFLIAGSVAVVVNSSEIGTRLAGQHVGEMAAIQPAQKRSATIVAHDTLVTLKLSSADFMTIGVKYGKIWLPIARELARRLYERNKLIHHPNENPKLFIISSSEATDIAEEIQRQLNPDVFSKLWKDGVFFAGGYPLEGLEKAVAESDFAIAIAQADDIIDARGIKSPTLRDNVLFELGLFMGKLTRFRAILVSPKVKGLKLPSDLSGLTLLTYEPDGPAPLSERLEPACNDIRKLVHNLGVRIAVNRT